MSNQHVSFRFRPIQLWAGPKANPKPSKFNTANGKTQHQLRYELSRLGVRSCVIQADLNESDIRNDGMPRANARFRSSRVIISFRHPKQGEVSFPCGTYEKFWDNVRAIVKTLEALRAVDRYGVTQRSEQYTGWKSLPPTSVERSDFDTVEEAAAYLVLIANRELSDFEIKRLIDEPSFCKEIFDLAAKQAHPDHGGSDAVMSKVNAARAMIKKQGGVS